MLADNDVLLQWSDINYWRRLCPHLTIDSSAAVGSDSTSTSTNDGDTDTREKLLQLLINDGYALIDNPICNDILQKNVCRGITDMEVEHLLPATFILLFDETWQLARESYHLLLQSDDGTKDIQQQQQSQKGILHRNSSTMAFNFDMLAWYIDPKLNQAGFSPHRDRQPDSLSDLTQSFYSDEQAKYITHWIALADATPENSCLYVIPKACDPGYLQGDDKPEGEGESDDGSFNNNNQLDPLSRALHTKQSYQNIRALPRTSGQSVIFTHRILHWGSRGNPNALNNHPRVAISFVYSDVDFEAPYLSKESFSRDGKSKGNWNHPPFETRLLLVCAQLLIYYQRFNLSISTLRACYTYCKAHSDQLDEKYKKKVFVEYVKAVKEQRDGMVQDCDKGKESDKNDTTCDKEGANSDDEEALLEEMLNNSGEFEDDYDEMLDECSDNGESQPKRMKHT